MTREPARAAVFAAGLDQATAGYRLPLEHLIPAAGRAGFQVLEVPAFAVARFRTRHGHVGLVRLLERHHVTIGQLSCGTGIPADLTVPAGRWVDAVQAWRGSCWLAAAVGCPRLSVFAGRAAADPPPSSAVTNAGMVATRVDELTAMAADHGLWVNAEFHAPALLQDAPQLLPATGNVGLLVDVAALALAGVDPAGYMAALPDGVIGWVHLADLPAPRPGEPAGRVLPGLGTLPLDRALRAAAARGYSGPVTVEVPRPQPHTLDAGPAAEHLRRAAAALTGEPLARFFALGSRR